MNFTAEQKEEIKSIGKMIAKDIAMSGISAVATMTLSSLLVSNYEKKSASGNKIVAATDEEVILQKNETKASSTESALSDDKVSAQKGGLDAVETEAKAATTDAKAMDTGASALRTKAGATDIGTKVLKLN
jgi:hypothetical protein